tara:strand:- start:905 stop:1591 length:687 start_codon:yes stop_codon:yes gene_type:complete
MNKKILLVSKAGKDEEQIKEQLYHANYSVYTAYTSGQAMQDLASNQYDLVIFQLKNFCHKKLELSKKLRKDGYLIPMIAIAESSDSEVLLEINKLYQTVVLQKPYKISELLGLIQKLTDGSRVGQQIHRRYRTNQKADLHVYSTGELLKTHIFNLSHSGAYLELDQNARFKKGDMVRLLVNLKQVNRSHMVLAKVVWKNNNGLWNEGQAVGLQFINKEEFYKIMLSNI